jgi:hypothetical protein
VAGAAGEVARGSADPDGASGRAGGRSGSLGFGAGSAETSTLGRGASLVRPPGAVAGLADAQPADTQTRNSQDASCARRIIVGGSAPG